MLSKRYQGSSGHPLPQEDVDIGFRIKRLLYDEGFTIAPARGGLCASMSKSR